MTQTIWMRAHESEVGRSLSDKFRFSIQLILRHPTLSRSITCESYNVTCMNKLARLELETNSCLTIRDKRSLFWSLKSCRMTFTSFFVFVTLERFSWFFVASSSNKFCSVSNLTFWNELSWVEGSSLSWAIAAGIWEYFSHFKNWKILDVCGSFAIENSVQLLISEMSSLTKFYNCVTLYSL